MGKFFIRFLIFVSGLLPAFAVAQGQRVETLCAGSEGAKHRVIFLHGKSKPEFLQKDKLIQQSGLLELAAAFDIRFAMPTAHGRCKSNPEEICWPQYSLDEIKTTLAEITADAKTCFGDAP